MAIIHDDDAKKDTFLIEESQKPKRKGGQLLGLLNIPPDFDAPLPDNIMKAFGKEME